MRSFASRRALLGSALGMSAAPLVTKRWLREERITSHYAQEAFESLQRFKASTTYPGSIRACTPGDTSCYKDNASDVLPDTRQRHYWRPVTDDPELATLVHLRIRFKERVFIAPDWETQLHVLVVSVPLDSTIAEIEAQIRASNVSPYIAQNPFTLALNGRQLKRDDSIEPLVMGSVEQQDLGNLGLTLDAIDTLQDHRWYDEDVVPKSWATHQLTPEEEASAPLDELRLLNQYGTQGNSSSVNYEREMPSRARPPASIGYRHHAVR